MFTHLLVPLDGSKLAESVLPATLELAKRLSARVTVLHILERAAPATVHGDRHLKQQGEADAYVAQVRDQMAAAGISADVRVVHADGDVANAIAGVAKTQNADLVVLCTHGGRGVRGFLFGRVAQQVLAHLAVPVLLLPPGAHTKDGTFSIRKLLLPLEGTHAADASISAASVVAKAFDAEVVLMTVVPTVNTMSGGRGASARMMPTTAAAVLDDEVGQARAFLQTVTERLAGEGVKAKAVVERGEPFRVLADSSAKGAVDAIVMATHGRTGVSVVFAGSIAARILERTPLPLLLIRIPER